MSPYALVVSGLGLLLILVSWFALKQRAANVEIEALLAHTNRKLERLQQHFGMFTPQEVIEHLTESEGRYTASRRMVTVLFADLQGFTRMCEDLDPEQVFAILNGYFQRMSEAISAHHGQVTELLGDGLLALFGALRTNPWQVQDAVMGALAMREALAHYNEELRAKSHQELSFGIGIHHGELLAGVVGHLELSKFGVVGDPINVAARVEGLTRLHDCDLLITEEVRSALDGRFRLKPMPAVSVKGKDAPLVTYFVEGLAEA